MSFVLFLFLGIWLLIIIRKDKAESDKKLEDYRKHYPPDKYREEYFRCFELYLQYAYIEPELHEHPNLDAVHDARLEILKSGFRPSSYPMIDVIDEYDHRLYSDTGVVNPSTISRGPTIKTWKSILSHCYSDTPEEGYQWDKKYNDFVDYYWDTISLIKNYDFSKKKEKIDQSHPQYWWYSYAKHNNLI